MGNVRKARDIDSALQKKGFCRELGGDHVYYYLTDANGKHLGILTKISHGMMGQTIGSELIARMSKQLGLSKKQFLDFIDCTLNEEDYRLIVE
ncbi:MAG: hypothetical protein ACRC2T_00665 [Thermoguttaceae bacterium]